MNHWPYTRSADLYDTIYATGLYDYDGEAATIAGLILDRQPEARSLLEVACGTGLFLDRFRRRFQVAGLDVSDEMLEIAAGRLEGVPLHHGDMRDFDLGTRFDAVVCLFSSIGYMTSDVDLAMALGRMADHLEPGGVLVVDGWLRPEQAIDGFVGMNAIDNDALRVARMSYTTLGDGVTDMEMHHLVGRPGHGIEYFVERHVMGLRGDGEYVAAIEAAGLADVAIVPGFQKRPRFVGVSPVP